MVSGRMSVRNRSRRAKSFKFGRIDVRSWTLDMDISPPPTAWLARGASLGILPRRDERNTGGDLMNEVIRTGRTPNGSTSTLAAE